jgi:hypothetical protein
LHLQDFVHQIDPFFGRLSALLTIHRTLIEIARLPDLLRIELRGFSAIASSLHPYQLVQCRARLCHRHDLLPRRRPERVEIAQNLPVPRRTLTANWCAGSNAGRIRGLNPSEKLVGRR